MIRRYFADIIYLVIALAVTLMLSGIPQAEKRHALPVASRSAGEKTTVAVPAKEIGQTKDGKAIGERNIFAASSLYSDKVQITIPANPYILLGIIQEETAMKALFREYTGTITKAAVGYRMLDGFRVAAVDKQQVILKQGREKKVFSVYGSAAMPVSGQGDQKDPAGSKPVLVAILAGADKRAVFQNPSGDLSILKIHQSLPDGYVLIRIDDRAVRLKHRKDEIELILYAKDPQRAGRSTRTMQALPIDAASPLPLPGQRRRPNPLYKKAGENDQGGGR